MGLFSINPVQRAQEEVNRCQAVLANMKANRDAAKKNGNYKNTAKNYRKGDKVGTVYDANVWTAEENLKKQKKGWPKQKRESDVYKNPMLCDSFAGCLLRPERL